MDATTSRILAVTVALLAAIALFALDGFAEGVALFAAGVLLVAVGVWGWQDSRHAPAAAADGRAVVLDDVSHRSTEDEVGEPVAARAADATGGDADGDPDGPQPTAEEPVPPVDVRATTEAVADPLGLTAPEDRTADTAPSEDVDDASPDPAPEVLATDGGHRHDRPIVNHSDLVTHVRDEHPDVATTGSTIQLRLLHEREHGGGA